MKLFEKIRDFFRKFKIKRLPAGSDVNPQVAAIMVEKNADTIEAMLPDCINYLSSVEILELIAKLPVKRRLFMLDTYKKYITPYELAGFVATKLDQDERLKALELFQYNLDLYDLYSVLDNVSPDRRIEALEKILDRLDSYSLSEVIKNYIPLVDRKDIMFKYEDMLDMFSKASIVEKLTPEDTLDVIEKYKNDFTKTVLFDIIKTLPENRIALALGMCQDKLDDSQVAELIMYSIPERERLKSLFEVAGRLKSATIADIIRCSLSDRDKKLALLRLKYFMEDEHVAEIVQNHMSTDSEMIEKLKDKMLLEDLAYFRKKAIGG